MNMMTSVRPTPSAPLALLRALPPGPLAAKYERLKRLAALFETFDRDDMEAGVDLLLAEMDAQDGDTDCEREEDRCEAGDDEIAVGPAIDRGGWMACARKWSDAPGSEDDAEPDYHGYGFRYVPADFAVAYAGDRGFGV